MELTRGENACEWEIDTLRTHFMGWLTQEDDFRVSHEEMSKWKREDLLEMLQARAEARYLEKEQLFGAEVFREVERAILLRNVDTAWMEHIDTMDDLKSNVGLQSYAQRDPVNEYRIQGADLFDAMVSDIRQKTARVILSVVPQAQPIQRVQVANPIVAGFEGARRTPVVTKRASSTVVRDSAQVGRNEPCPCGSGKKYKNCCMRSHGQA